MEEGDEQRNSIWEGYADWRGRPAVKGRHGGFTAALFVLGVEVLENLAFLANASNLVVYLSEYMHYPPSKSANNVTNFMGTAFLLALLGGFLSDALFTTYHIYLISSLIQLLGLIVLTTQARVASLKPAPCDLTNPTTTCEQPGRAQAAMLFLGLYTVAVGVGGIKGSLAAHGAEQFDESSPKGRKQRSTFFNYFVFCLALGALIAVTLVVWIEDNKGWEWGLGIATLAIFFSIPLFLAGSPTYRNKLPSPSGSPLATIFKVVVAATLNTCLTKNSTHSDNRAKHNHQLRQLQDKTNPTQSLHFLNRAISDDPPFRCTVPQVEEVKTVLKMLPIFASTIMLNTCLAQLSTFSVQQAATMDTNLGRLEVPPASLPVFPVVFIMTMAPLYDHVIVPFARRLTKSESGVTHLQRVGFGLVLSVLAMAVAALIEIKRKRVFSGLDRPEHPLPITFLWVGFQYLLLGSADLFTLAGLLEFFFSEAPATMRSLATSLSFASLAVGYYMSSVMVSVVNRATGGNGKGSWLSGRDLNEFHLERFYWLMCGLSGLNFMFFLFWAVRYKYKAINISM